MFACSHPSLLAYTNVRRYRSLSLPSLHERAVFACSHPSLIAYTNVRCYRSRVRIRQSHRSHERAVRIRLSLLTRPCGVIFRVFASPKSTNQSPVMLMLCTPHFGPYAHMSSALPMSRGTVQFLAWIQPGVHCESWLCHACARRMTRTHTSHLTLVVKPGSEWFASAACSLSSAFQ